ncbi:MAG: HEAT repeat domain-containing protein [Anaerolineae bacterium]
MGNCDICNGQIDNGARRLTADALRQAVASGYRPAGMQPGGHLAGVGEMMGLPAEHAMAGWLQQVEQDATDWALCEKCVAEISPYISSQPAAQNEAEEETAVLHPTTLTARIQPWATQIRTAQKQVTARKWFSFLIGGGGSLAIATLLSLFFPRLAGSIFCWGLVGSAAAWTAIYYLWPQRLEKQAVTQITADIQAAETAEKLSAPDIAEALAAQAPTGSIRQAVLTAVDPPTAAMLEIRDKALPFFNKKKKAVAESDAIAFRGHTLEYLSHKLYTEAGAALGMVATLYAEVAPPFADNVNVDQLIRNTYDQNQRVALARRNVLSKFEFEDDIKAITETAGKRRQASLWQMLLAAQQEDTDTVNALVESGAAFKPLVRDKAFVGACIDYLGPQATQKMAALNAITQIPDVRVLPYLLQVFDLIPFYPQGIDAASRIGESTHAPLLDALRTGSPNQRFNIALALGIMDVEAAKPVFSELLPNATLPKDRIAYHYGLARLGAAGHLEQLIQELNQNQGEAAHAAVITLEHLADPLPEAVYAQHLNHPHNLVRLRLTRKLGKQGTTSPTLIDALIGRFSDSEESVRSAAVTAVATVDANLVYDRIVQLAQGGTGTTQICALQVLGKLGQPQAIPLLTTTLENTGAADIRQTVMSALADLQAVETAPKIGRFLHNDKLSGAAFWAILRLGFQDKDRIKDILKWQGVSQLQRLFALTLLGDEKAEKQFKAKLSGGTDIQTLLQACDFARILSRPAFAGSLRSLLTYSNETYTPTDKLIPYTAFKALVHTMLAEA